MKGLFYFAFILALVVVFDTKAMEEPSNQLRQLNDDNTDELVEENARTLDEEEEDDDDDDDDVTSKYNSQYFIGVQKKRTWLGAENYCKNRYHTHLATVNTQHKLDDIYNLWKENFHYETIWIGLHEDQRSGPMNRDGWEWTSGTPYAQQAWWRQGQPNQHFEDCVIFGKKSAQEMG